MSNQSKLDGTPVSTALLARDNVSAQELRALGSEALVSLTRALFEDRARVKEERQRFLDEAGMDFLTGLPNRRNLERDFSRLALRAERDLVPIALALIDVDRFKSVNDTHGHPVGDQVLKRFGAVLLEESRAFDLVARYGGEEFLIVLYGVEMRQARAIIERIRTKLASACKENRLPAVTASAGVALSAVSGFSFEKLCGDADRALYAAKDSGRNRAVFADNQFLRDERRSETKSKERDGQESERRKR